MTFRKHPGIWFTLWTGVTLFLWLFLFANIPMNQFQYNLSQLFIRVWYLVCVWWIIYFHVQWIEKLMTKQGKDDERQV